VNLLFEVFLCLDYKVIRSGNYKYIHWVRYPEKNELYDIEKDSLEMENLINKIELQPVINQLKKELIVLIGKASGIE